MSQSGEEKIQTLEPDRGPGRGLASNPLFRSCLFCVQGSGARVVYLGTGGELYLELS